MKFRQFLIERRKTDPLKTLQKKLGYTFKRPRVLDRALTPRAATGRGQGRNSEKHEFVGDRALNMAVAELLIQRGFSEAEAGKLISQLIDRRTAADVARKLGIPKLLRLPDGDPNNHRGSNKTLTDAMEAILGAIHFDGGRDASVKAARRLWRPLVKRSALMGVRDWKTDLQELTQKRGKRPTYAKVSQSGPQNALSFTVECKLGTAKTTGKGSTLKAAEQKAAKAMLTKLGGA